MLLKSISLIMPITITNNMPLFLISDYDILDTRFNFSFNFNMPDDNFIYKLKRIEIFINKIKRKK